MTIFDSFWLAIRSLRANPMRSVLTMLGIIIGVGSVITMVAVGAGAQTQVADQIRSFGANVLMVNPGSSNRGGVRSASGIGHTLTDRDARAIAELSSINSTAPCVWGTAQIVHGDKNWNTTVNGTTLDQFSIREWRLKAGRLFSPSEESDSAKVAVLGATVAEKLFGKKDPLGQETRILNTPFEVIGVLAAKGPLASGANQDDVVFVPLLTARLRLIGSASNVNREAVAYILAKAASDQDMRTAKAQIEALLRQRHRITAGSEDDFFVNNPEAAMAAQKESTRTVAILLASIASVSLVVGGISIMNIMLVSITERTREIGLRIAIGARRRDIRNQFLTEAITLCMIGGIVGVALGGATAWTIARLAGWPIFLGADALFIAVGFSGAIGVFFGYYPARKAARLEPVAALRAE